ncbi:MAG: hypothetical protein B6D64_02190 [Bacteroidetes bacterium 4484_276]|nr:MAG: hypothetical protein B6D64_02190 [Bacteroidetes bacterium 4484_276]
MTGLWFQVLGRDAIPDPESFRERGDGGPGTEPNQGFHPFPLVRDLNPCSTVLSFSPESFRDQVALGLLHPTPGIHHPSFFKFRVLGLFAFYWRRGKLKYLQFETITIMQPSLVLP